MTDKQKAIYHPVEILSEINRLCCNLLDHDKNISSIEITWQKICKDEESSTIIIPNLKVQKAIWS